MRKRRSSREFGSLDSLLDTVTNVVGILIFVVIVAILGLRDAVGRVPEGGQEEDTPRVSMEDLCQAEEYRERAIEALSVLKARWGVLEAKLPEDAAELEALNRRIQDLMREVGDPTNLKTRLEELLVELKKLEAELAALEKLHQDGQKERDELVKRNEQLDKESASRTVALPDLTVVSDMESIPFFCRRGKACRIDGEELTKKLNTSATEIGATENGQLHLKNIEKLSAHLERADVGDPTCRLKVIVNKGFFGNIERVQLRFEPREDVGETKDRIASPDSKYQDSLRRLDKTKQVLTFFVWDDSFEAYLKAYEEAARAGFRCGWVPYRDGEWLDVQIYPAIQSDTSVQ